MALSKDVRKLFKDWYKSSRQGRENRNATDRLSESLRFQRRRIWDHDGLICELDDYSLGMDDEDLFAVLAEI